MRIIIITALIILLGIAACAGDSKEPPNILLILIDTLRADHVHCYGYERDITPTLDSLAAEGTMWTNVQGQSAWTLPSMATIYTGLTERQHLAGIRDNQQYALDEELLTLPEIFHQNDYQTAGFYTVPVMDEGYGFDQGMDHCDMEGCSVIFPSDIMVDKYITWADSLYDENTPFFTILHFFDPHFQYNPPIQWAGLYSSIYHPGTRWALCPASVMIEAWGKGMISKDDLSRMLDLYDGEIAYLNTQISRLFSEMRARDMLENTLVVVISDHGEEFGEHGGVTHGVHLHSEITNLPLIISGPGISSGKIESVLAGQVDIMPTILSYAGLPVPDFVVGADLLESTLSDNRILPASGYHADVNDFITVRQGNLKLFWNPQTDSSFMYDLSDDYFEQKLLPIDSTLLEEAALYWATPPVINPVPMQNMEHRVEMFRNLGYLR